MKFGPKPFGPMRLIVRNNAIEYTVTRASKSVGSMGDVTETTNTHTASMWVYDPNEVRIKIELGERLNGDIEALSLPSQNIQVDDRITHGAHDYEVESIVSIPHEDNQQLIRLSFVRITN